MIIKYILVGFKHINECADVYKAFDCVCYAEMEAQALKEKGYKRVIIREETTYEGGCSISSIYSKWVNPSVKESC